MLTSLHFNSLKYFFTADADVEMKYPVIVFIHGESYEWNSGNPYDGSVLAAYAKVVVVTFNFRLGILGELETTNFTIFSYRIKININHNES